MNIKDFALMFGIFILIFYASSSFIQMFNFSYSMPSEISDAWNASMSQTESARSAVSKSVSNIMSGEPLQVMSGIFSLAFNGIFYIIISLWNVFVTIPQSIWGAANYLARSFGIPSVIIDVLISIITVMVILKAIEFITGRYFT